MALYHYEQIASSGNVSNTIMERLGTFAADNGWTVDFDGVYNTTWRRLHIHKGEAHFDFYSSATTTINAYGCTGYAAGSTPANQPGAHVSAVNYNFVFNGWFAFFSTVGGLYIGVKAITIAGTWGWGGVFIVQQKIGTWANGFGITGTGGEWGFSATASNAPSYLRLYYNGAWSNAATAGGVVGLLETQGVYGYSLPNFYNAGILPFPVPLFLTNPTDTTKLTPLGSFPGLYFSNGGDLYDLFDTITIGSDTYMWMPTLKSMLGHQNYADILFKLGA